VMMTECFILVCSTMLGHLNCPYSHYAIDDPPLHLSIGIRARSGEETVVTVTVTVTV
jgi:hypothetical protein